MAPKKPNPFEGFLADRSNRERTNVLLQPDSPEEHSRDQEAEGIDVKRAVADRGYEETSCNRAEDLDCPVSGIDDRIRGGQVTRVNDSRDQGKAGRIEDRPADRRAEHEDVGHEQWKTETKDYRHSPDKQNSPKVASDHGSAMADRICDRAPKDYEERVRDRRDDHGERSNQRGSCLHVTDIRESDQRYRITEPAGDLSEPQGRETRGPKRTKRHDVGVGRHLALTRRKTIQKPPI